MWAAIGAAAARMAGAARGLGGVARAAGRGVRGVAGKMDGGSLIGLGLTGLSLPGMVSSGLDLSDNVFGTDLLGRKRDSRSIANSALSEMMRQNDELSFMEGQEFLKSSQLNELGMGQPTPLFDPGEDVEMAGLQQLLMREQAKLGMAASRQSQHPTLYELAQRIGADV